MAALGELMGQCGWGDIGACGCAGFVYTELIEVPQVQGQETPSLKVKIVGVSHLASDRSPSVLKIASV